MVRCEHQPRTCIMWLLWNSVAGESGYIIDRRLIGVGGVGSYQSTVRSIVLWYTLSPSSPGSQPQARRSMRAHVSLCRGLHGGLGAIVPMLSGKELSLPPY